LESCTFFQYASKDQIPKGEEETGIFRAIESLASNKIGFTKIYFAPRIQVLEHGLKSLGGLKPKRIIESQLAAMRKSRCVLFILSEPLCSSALVKIGWAMAMEKVCFIVETRKGILPKILRKDYEKILYHPENLLAIKDIPEWLALENAARLLD
jgi:hypothetical protein